MLGRPATLQLPMTVRRPAPGVGLTLPLVEGWPDPDLDTLRLELSRGNFQWVEDFFKENPDPEIRLFYLDGVQQSAEANGWVDAWLSRSPESAIARLVCGVWAVGWAWKARGASPAAVLSADAHGQFAERLETAERWLFQAAELDPLDPVPWAYLVVAARGRALGPVEWHRRCDEGTKRGKLYRFEQQKHLFLCAKWGGSHAQMFEHARAASTASPPGSVAHTLVALAHIERWLFASNNRELDADAWWTRPEVKDELIAAAKRSVLSPDWRTDDRRCSAELNAWAFVLYRIGERESAKSVLDRLAGVWVEVPWVYMGDPKVVYQRARQEGARPQGAPPPRRPANPAPPPVDDDVAGTVTRILGAITAVIGLTLVGATATIVLGTVAICGGCIGLIFVVPPTTDSVADARAAELAKIPVDTRYDRLEKLMIQIEDDARDNRISIMQWQKVEDQIKSATRDGTLTEAEILKIETDYAKR